MAITLVGGSSNSGENVDVSITLPGGIAENDVCLGGYSTDTTSNADLSMVTAGYTELADLYANDTVDSNLGVFIKKQGPTPDSTFQVEGTAFNKVCAGVQVWRGVDTTTQLDATTTTATGLNSGLPDAASITTATNGARVVVVAGSSQHGIATAPSGYGDLIQADENDCWFGIASIDKATAGAEDPGAFGGITGTTADCWTAATVALRPAVTSISGTASITLDAVTSSAAGTVLVAGTASVTLGDVTSSAAGTVAVKGAADITLGAATVSATAVVPIVGQASVTFSDITLDAAGVVGAAVIEGTLSVTLADLTTTAAGVLPIVGNSSVTLDALVSTAAGVVPLTGVAAITLADVTSAAAGTVPVLGVSSIILDDVLSSAQGAIQVKGALAKTLADVTLVATTSEQRGGGILLCGL